MRISILTQHLGHNYGGLLQAYALQTVLRDQGHEVETLDRRKPERRAPSNLTARLRNTLRYALSRRRVRLEEFRNQHIRMSDRIDSEAKLRDYYRQHPADAVIVGSDQVWRPRYSPSLTNFFLDFLDDIESADVPAPRRISYAASFGVDNWEFSADQTSTCKFLAQKFNAISVREHSAQVLCREHLGVAAEWVVDPTFLLAAADYQKFMPTGTSPHRGKVLTYVLDPADDKQAVAGKVVSTLKADLFSVNQRGSLRPFAGVGEWLQGFQDASFVITDSFHGCVFSIIFNKPFLAVGNAERGVARFDSLLDLFGLKDRFVGAPKDVNAELTRGLIDWTSVDRVRSREAEKGKAFLARNLQPEHRKTKD